MVAMQTAQRIALSVTDWYAVETPHPTDADRTYFVARSASDPSQWTSGKTLAQVEDNAAFFAANCRPLSLAGR